MTYLTLEDIKRQCRIEPEFTEDDNILEIYGDSAENFLEVHLNCALDDIVAENGGELPKCLYQALLLLVDYSYDNSGSGESREVPNAFWILCKPYQKYTIA